MKILTEAKFVERVSYYLYFEWVDRPGAGYAFECDEHGNVSDLHELAEANYRRVVSGAYGDKLVAQGVQRRVHRFRDPAIGRCDVCCRRVPLTHALVNTCRCGAEYSGSGQRLAPRSEWGKETGETDADIDRANHAFWRG